MAAPTINQVCQTLAQIAPLKLAESWDNVGLLVGDRDLAVQRIMTCLTVTPDVVAEAIERGAGLVITHHPLPFRPLSRLTCDSIAGKNLWRLIGAQTAIYSAHTAFDSCAQGINQTWAESLQLQDIRAIVDPVDGNDLGSGRYGDLPQPMPARDVISRCVSIVESSSRPRGVGPLDAQVTRIGFACGSGGSFVPKAVRRGCELLITGEAAFHDCLEAESNQMALGLLGHYFSERFAMDQLAKTLAEHYPEVEIWASERESDPVQDL